MGDSMNQARVFMRNCQTALFDMAASTVSLSGSLSGASLSTSNPNQPARLNADVCVAALTSVQTGAKRNHALAIYRAAQQALNAIDSPDLLSGRIERLSYLISQYETGLLELENDTETHHGADALDLNSAALLNDNNAANHYSTKAQACSALNDTLKLANSAERPALETLLSLSQNSERQSFNAKPSLEDPPVSSDKPIAPPAVPLEELVQDIVQLGLTVARQYGLTLSLSYDMRDKRIAENKAERFKMRSCQWVTYLIRHIAASQTVDALADSIAHIDIAATETALRLSTIAPGLPVSFRQSAPDGDNISPTYNARTNSLSLDIAYKEATSETQNDDGQNNISNNKPPKTPVEEGISARLEALLAGNTQLVALEPKRAAS